MKIENLYVIFGLRKPIKCKKCDFFKLQQREGAEGEGDCVNPIVRGKNGMIWLYFCEDFTISSEFGCIYAKEKK